MHKDFNRAIHLPAIEVVNHKNETLNINTIFEKQRLFIFGIMPVVIILKIVILR